ncbi:hypothetical protein [Rhodococcus marinonascens]|uniref:hypothetical protein n=1 Tax=Rhodococcus marinonascens TaxID=38311 RepID=UPI000B286735|nr:hypothetical protein [Rhodococcus marinonascens]
MKRYISETWRAVSRRGLRAVIAYVIIATGGIWAAGWGFSVAAGGFVAGMTCGAVALLLIARASVNSAGPER